MDHWSQENGKPCVVGLEHATTLFKDGQLVEMDGTTGIIIYHRRHRSSMKKLLKCNQLIAFLLLWII